LAAQRNRVWSIEADDSHRKYDRRCLSGC